MSLVGQVTKVGLMHKTATVTVSRFIFHPKTGKVRPSVRPSNADVLRRISCNGVQRLERSKKYLTHDENNRAFSLLPLNYVSVHPD